MSIDKLLDLKNRVETLLASKVTEQRRALESELSKLTRFGGARGGSKSVFGSRGTVAPKYRNPENPAETWAGRGLRPRWLTAAIKAGQKLEDFAIASAATKAGAKKKKVTKRTGKTKRSASAA
jgi:DNA-binding protein H-NS